MKPSKVIVRPFATGTTISCGDAGTPGPPGLNVEMEDSLSLFLSESQIQALKDAARGEARRTTPPLPAPTAMAPTGSCRKPGMLRATCSWVSRAGFVAGFVSGGLAVLAWPVPSPSNLVVAAPTSTPQELVSTLSDVQTRAVTTQFFQQDAAPLALEQKASPPPTAAPVHRDAAAPRTAMAVPVSNARSSAPSESKPAEAPAREVVFEGTLFVDSVPAGAAVLIDRRRVGETPIEIPNLRAGSHVVWLEREGFVRWTGGVHVPADRVTRVNPRLEPLREPRQ